MNTPPKLRCGHPVECTSNDGAWCLWCAEVAGLRGSAAEQKAEVDYLHRSLAGLDAHLSGADPEAEGARAEALEALWDRMGPEARARVEASVRQVARVVALAERARPVLEAVSNQPEPSDLRSQARMALASMWAEINAGPDQPAKVETRSAPKRWPTLPGGLDVTASKHLPPGSMVVSPDVFEAIKAASDAAGKE